MIKTLIIADQYTAIVKAQKVGASGEEISQIISTPDCNISRQLIAKTITKINNKSLLPAANDLICFFPFNNEGNAELYNFSISFCNLFITTKIAINDLDPKWIITSDNIKLLNSANARIAAKWLLQDFQLSNSYLLDDYQLEESEANYIQKMPSLVSQQLITLNKDATDKYFRWILNKL